MTLRRRIGRRRCSGADESPAARRRQPAAPRAAPRGKMLRAKPPNVVGRGPLLGGPGLRRRHRLHRQGRGRLPRGVAGLSRRARCRPLRHLRQRLHRRQRRAAGALHQPRPRDAHRLAPRRRPAVGLQPRPADVRRRRREWMAYYDVDEFLVPLLDDDIPSFLARFDDAADVRVPARRVRLLGASHAARAACPSTPTRRSPMCSTSTPIVPPRVKSIVQPGAVSAMDIHLAFPADDPGAGRADRDGRGGGARAWPSSTTTTRARSRSSRPSASAAGHRRASPGRRCPATSTPSRPRHVRVSATRQRTQAAIGTAAQPGAQALRLRQPAGAASTSRGPTTSSASASSPSPTSPPASTSPSASRRRASRTCYRGVGLVADLAGDDSRRSARRFSGSAHTEALVRAPAAAASRPASAGSAELPMMASGGHADHPRGGPATLDLPAGVAEVLLELPRERDAALLLAGLRGRSRRRRSASRPSVTTADGSERCPSSWSCRPRRRVAGVVEVEPLPDARRARMRLRFESEADAARHLRPLRHLLRLGCATWR